MPCSYEENTDKSRRRHARLEIGFQGLPNAHNDTHCNPIQVVFVAQGFIMGIPKNNPWTNNYLIFLYIFCNKALQSLEHSLLLY